MHYNSIDWCINNHILTLTLNRPDDMNAFTVEMANELEDAFRRASNDDSVRAIVVTGAGKAFCAGMDLSREGNVFGLNETLNPTLKDMHERLEDPAIHHGVRDTGGRVVLAMYDCNKPIIGAINGPAVGIGATMTLGMDIRIASEKAKIGFVFGKIGVTPEACSGWFLPRIVGMPTALEWVMSAEIMPPQTAHKAGLFRDVLAPEELLPAAYALAEKFVKNRSPIATALARHLMYRNCAVAHPLDAHKTDSLAIYYASLKDGKEGVASFLEKREPHFQSQCSSDMPDFVNEWIKASP